MRHEKTTLVDMSNSAPAATTTTTAAATATPTCCTPTTIIDGKKKRVSFGEVQEYFLAPFPRDLQRQHLYYSSEELQIQKEADIDAKKQKQQSSHGHRRGNKNKNRGHGCEERGLEHVLNKGERRDHIREFVRTVLEVHAEQRDMGYYDDYEVYMVSRSHSKKDRKQALKMAAQDAHDVVALQQQEQHEHEETRKHRQQRQQQQDDDDTATVATLDIDESCSSTYNTIRPKSGGGRRKSHNRILKRFRGTLSRVWSSNKSLIKKPRDPVRRAATV